MSGERRPTFGSATMHVGPDGWVHFSAYDDGHLPNLSVHGGGIGLTVYLSGEVIDADHVRFARELAGAARKFAAECERLQVEDTKAAGGKAA